MGRPVVRRLTAWAIWSCIALAMAVWVDQSAMSEVRAFLGASRIRPFGFFGLNPYLYLAYGFCLGGFAVLGVKTICRGDRHRKIERIFRAVLVISPWIFVWIIIWFTGDWLMWIFILAFEAMLEL